jgi:cytochrome P450
VTVRETAGVHLESFQEVREALRQDDLRQALYNEAPFMQEALISLHGDGHRRRRRAEQPLFSRDALGLRETTVVAIAERTLRPFREAGKADLMRFGREVSVNLASSIAGIDRPAQTAAETAELLDLIQAFSESSTVANSRRDPDAVRSDAEAAWKRYLDLYLDPSIERRRRLLESGSNPAGDIVTVMLQHGGVLSETALRQEATLYMTATVGTAPGVLVATFDELRKRWLERPALRAAEAGDLRFLQRAAWETIRLHPANPQHLRRADRRVILHSGTVIEKDQLVFLDVIAANRDPTIFGPTADAFDPHRPLPAGVAAWGLGFGAGIHVCMGQNLAGGTDSLLGMLAILLSILLPYEPALDPDDLPRIATTTTRRTWETYPIRF